MTTPGSVLDRLTTVLADRYRIERELGQGGMATVYLAEDVRHHRKVAIKVLHPELSAILGTERFLKEIELTANLQHPHILPLFDSGSADGLLYYVMPYVEGETLRGRLTREHQLPIPDAVRIASEVADALEYAHKRGVIHRDIKPENVLLQEGHALVADFGIALAVQQAGGARMTQTGLSLGTPQYMAPEQATGERDITARADIYSLGAVTYEMIAGEAPFTGPNSQAIVAKVITESPRPLSRQRRTVPENVEAAVMTALEKLPADRFGSAAELAAGLRGEGPKTARMARSTAAYYGDSTTRASRIRQAAVLATVLAFGALAGWAAHRPPTVARPAVRFSFVPDSVNPLEACCGYQVALSPDNRWLAYVAESHGTSRIYVRNLDDVVSRPLAGTEGAMEVFVSPDGQWIAFRVPAIGPSGGELRRVPVTGGAPTLVAVTSGFAYGATWTSDGSIVYAAERQPLRRVPSGGGTGAAIAGTDSAQHPRYVADGDAILFTQRRGTGQHVRLLSLASGEIRDVVEGRAPSYTAAGYLLSVTPAGTLVAQRFDPRAARLSGSPMSIAADLARPIDYAVTDDGMLFYGAGKSGGVLSLVDLRGNAQLLPFRVEGATHFDNPHYSPDGRRLALIAGRSPGHELFMLDLERGTSLRMTFGGTTEFVDWTPDGRRVVYVKDDSVLAVQPADRSASERVLLSVGARQLARVSVGGRWVAYAVHPVDTPRASDIFLVPLDSSASAARPYLATQFTEMAPALAPDGRWLAYVSDETGRPEVYVGSVPVTGAREAISTEGGREPVWARDGRTLYYRTLDGELIAVKVSPGAQLAVASRASVLRTNAELSLNGADFDVHPSGNSILMMRSRTVDTRLMVITDAFARGGPTR